MMKHEVFKIFIGCLPSDSTTEELTAYLSMFCKVKNLKIRFRKNGICAGYGHAFLISDSGSFKDFLALDHLYQGRALEIRPFYS